MKNNIETTVDKLAEYLRNIIEDKQTSPSEVANVASALASLVQASTYANFE